MPLIKITGVGPQSYWNAFKEGKIPPGSWVDPIQNTSLMPEYKVMASGVFWPLPHAEIYLGAENFLPEEVLEDKARWIAFYFLDEEEDSALLANQRDAE